MYILDKHRSTSCNRDNAVFDEEYGKAMSTHLSTWTNVTLALQIYTRIKKSRANISFCCNNCVKKTKKSDDKVSLIFSDASFDKGFTAVNKSKSKKKK